MIKGERREEKRSGGGSRKGGGRELMQEKRQKKKILKDILEERGKKIWKRRTERREGITAMILHRWCSHL